jgi:methylated-DNA-[protein]-cysteine S-methyltransferase
MTPRHLVRLTSPLGRIEITSDDELLTGLSIERAGVLPHDELPDSPSAVLDDAAKQLDEYFAGERHDFDLPLHLTGTPFQHAIWSALRELGWGESASYGELGRSAGRPGSARAVGGAVGSNPFPLFIGCHRVLARDRSITGYSAGNGIPTKIWLLEHEGIVYGGTPSGRLELPGLELPGLEPPAPEPPVPAPSELVVSGRRV